MDFVEQVVTGAKIWSVKVLLVMISLLQPERLCGWNVAESLS